VLGVQDWDRSVANDFGKGGSEQNSRPTELQFAALDASGYFASAGFITLFGSGFTG
jgi:hypothetical protein